jgi:hypothetical protein
MLGTDLIAPGACPPFSPCGRRWPEGPDEGSRRPVSSTTLAIMVARPLTPALSRKGRGGMSRLDITPEA